MSTIIVPPGLARRETGPWARLPSPEDDTLASSESLDLGVGASLWQPFTTNLKLFRAPEQTLPARVHAPHVGQFSSHYTNSNSVRSPKRKVLVQKEGGWGPWVLSGRYADLGLPQLAKRTPVALGYSNHGSREKLLQVV